MSKKATLSQKLRYKFELFMNKGGSSIFLSLLVLFIVCFLIIISIRAIIVYGFGYDGVEYNTIDSFWDHIWYTFLQMTDPGNMYQDSMQDSGWIKIATVLSGFVGVIILSALIAFITTQLEQLLYNFRKGRGPVLESDHTVILGWNTRVTGVIEELVIANESEKSASIVILSEVDKEEVDNYIFKNITDTGTTKIITTSGSTSSLKEFDRINIQEAKSVIIMASSKDMASKQEKIDSDVNTIKSILAINAFFKSDIPVPVIAEIFFDDNRKLVEMLDTDNIIAIDNWEIMGKLLVQTSLTSGLQIVYNEILSFDLSEIYYYNNPAWKGIPFNQLPYHFPDGVPLGVNNDSGVILRPEDNYVMKADDEILILAEDDSTIDFSSNQLYNPNSQEYSAKTTEKQNKKVLILGWHSIGEIYVKESDDYLLEGSIFDIYIPEPNQDLSKEITLIDETYTNIKVNLIDKDPMQLEVLNEINPFSYDTILILATDLNEVSEDRIDSNTLLLLLMLQNIEKTLPDTETNNTKIITQLLNANNQQLMTQTKVNDFLISNRMITMILAQLSEEPKIKAFYDDIFQEDGSEIYVKPITLYYDEFPISVPFKDLIDISQKREEICLGVRFEKDKNKPENNFGVLLNPEKEETITLEKNDFLVVLSEDEL